jgi:hypothetical protein
MTDPKATPIRKRRSLLRLSTLSQRKWRRNEFQKEGHDHSGNRIFQMWSPDSGRVWSCGFGISQRWIWNNSVKYVSSEAGGVDIGCCSMLNICSDQ